jgi:spore coat protein SA
MWAPKFQNCHEVLVLAPMFCKFDKEDGTVMIYHLLPGAESFSMFSGLALARDVANMMHFDDSAIVVCREADDSWGFPADRSLVIPQMRIFGRMKGRKYIPRAITTPFFRHIFEPFLAALKSGDIVWVHNQPFWCAALAPFIRAKGAKLVYHAHNPLTDRPHRSAFRVFTPDACIFVSDMIRQRALKWIPWLSNTYVVHNGADDALFYPAPPESRPKNPAPVVLFVGRLEPRKGVHVLIEAMRLLQQRKTNVRCRIIGESFLHGSKVTPYLRDLRENCPSNVEFKGFCPQTALGEQYRSADIHCCPSVWQEPFGNVNIEAMACGIPVVASRVGGIPEIAADGGVVLVGPNSAVELANALQKIAEDENFRKQIAAEGLSAFRKRFTWAAICDQYQMIANSVIQTETEEVACELQQQYQA